MNERIQELAVQAKEYARSHVEDCRRFGYYMEYNEYELRFEKKFAELIVGECVKKCEFVAAMAEITNTGEMARKTKATADSCAQMIGQHFGVEQ